MPQYTQHQIRFFAEQLLLKRPQHTVEGLASAMSGVKIDLNSHQVDAARFALQSPLSDGVLLADEVGLGKTIEAGLVLAQCWSERKRKILLIVTASLRTQWRAELDEKFYIPCHRYGQRFDVIVINFLNQANAADQRVYQLLDQKFRLFDGVFGSSDDVLGTIEDGVDFEKRILDIYQNFREPDDIKAAFDALQDELSDQISEKMTEARQSILDNFDEDIANRLKGCDSDTKAGLSKFNQWLYCFFLMKGAERVEPLDQLRFAYNENGEQKTFNLDWNDAEAQRDIFLRRDDKMCQDWLTRVD